MPGKDSAGSYDNPAYKGDGGDRAKPAAKGGSTSGQYDNAPSASDKGERPKEKPSGGGASQSGYDDAKINGDFGFSGHKKHRSPNV